MTGMSLMPCLNDSMSSVEVTMSLPLFGLQVNCLERENCQGF